MTLIPPVCPPPHAVLEPPPVGSTRAATLPHSLFNTHAYTHIYIYI